MFNKYKQLILSMFVVICCLTDITHAKSLVKLSDHHASHCALHLHHHYKHLSRHALRKTTLAMRRAHQKALDACRRAYYHSIKHYEARTCPQAKQQAQQHELLKHLAQLQAQCALSQEETARTLQTTQQALQLQQEATAAIINQLSEKLAYMQQQYTVLEQKYRRLEEHTKEQQVLPLVPTSSAPRSENELSKEPQDAQELEQDSVQAQEQPYQQNQQDTAQDQDKQENTAQESPELQEEQQQLDPAQQAALEELLGKEHNKQNQVNNAQAPALDSKEPQPELQLDVDNADQESAQQDALANTHNNTQKVEALVPEEEVFGKSVADDDDQDFNENEQDAAFEQRLFALLQEKQQIINRLSQEKQELERENAQARQTIAHLQQELEKHEITLQEALEPLITGAPQPQQENAVQAAANSQRVVQRAPEQQELEDYQTTLNEVLDLYNQQATEKKTLQQNLTQARNYIDQQKIQEQQAEQALHETRAELINTNQQLTRTLVGVTTEQKNREDIEKAYKTLQRQITRPCISQATQTQTDDIQTQATQEAIRAQIYPTAGISVQTKFVSLTSSPDTNDAQGNYTLTFTIGDKIIPMSKHDTEERNKQATEALIETLETIEEEECTQIQACLQKALESCSNPQECVKILRNIFYKRGPEISPHPTIISLIDPSLMQITENYTHLGAHQSVLCKMIEAYADIDNQEDSNSTRTR